MAAQAGAILVRAGGPPAPSPGNRRLSLNGWAGAPGYGPDGVWSLLRFLSVPSLNWIFTNEPQPRG